MLGVTYNDQNRGVLLLGYYLTSVYPAISMHPLDYDKLIEYVLIQAAPLIYSWFGQNTGGDTKRKVTTGVRISIWQ